MINKVILIGNVGKDPEIRTMSNGNEVASFSLATSFNYKNKETGEKKQKTEWHRISIYRIGLVNIVKQYVKKGIKLYIEGSLQTNKVTNNQGIERYYTDIVLKDFRSILIILNSKKEDLNKKEQEKIQKNQDINFATEKEYNNLNYDEQIPF